MRLTPDALPIPGDLIQLQRAVTAAEDALVDHTLEVAARQRAAHPGADRESVLARVTWPETDSAEHDVLRAAAAEVRPSAEWDAAPLSAPTVAVPPWTLVTSPDWPQPSSPSAHC